jgi:NHL repeat
VSERHGKESASNAALIRSVGRVLALFVALLVSLTFTAVASADVSFIKAYGWGVSNGASQFETCTSTCRAGIAGAGAGQFGESDAINPESIATDSSGDVYITDYVNDRIEEFSPAGAFLKTYGWGVLDGANQFETCTSTCRSGNAGAGAGQFYAPYGIATDSSGDVYVADDGNYRIDEFSAAGALIKAYGWGVLDGANQFETCTTTTTCRDGREGDGAGELDGPAGVATDPSGDVYVADTDNDRIEEFSPAGAFIKAIGMAGSGAGQLNGPLGVAADSSGDVYVADTENNRIDEFSAAGAFIKAYGWGVSDGQGRFETCTSTCQAGIAGPSAGQLEYPAGVATDSSGDVYVVDGQRIDEFSAAGAFLEAFGWGVADGMSQFETCTSTCRTGIGGGGAGQLDGPNGVATDGSGDIYVADSGNYRTDEFSVPNGRTPTVSVTDDAGGKSPGETVTFTATVTGSGGVTPTGALTWALTDPDGDSIPCASSTGPDGNGSVATYTCSVDNVIPGPYAATATYPADSNYDMASGTDTAKVAPVVALSDDSQPSLLSGNTVTFTATLTGSDGIPPEGPVDWHLTVPGGEPLLDCESSDGPTDSGDVATYTCSVPRADAAEAGVGFEGEADPRYGYTAGVVDDPAVINWDGPPNDKFPFEVETTLLRTLTGSMVSDETLATSGTATNTLLAPALNPAPTILPALPLGVTVATSVGGLPPLRSVTLSLITGDLSGGPADVSADPPFSSPDQNPPSASESASAFELKDGYYELPLYDQARTITLSFTDVAPSSFGATLEDSAKVTLKVNRTAMEAEAVLVAVPVIVASIEGGAVAAVGEGAAALIGRIGAWLEQLIPELPSPSSVLQSISNAVRGAAATVWNALAPSAGAAPAGAASAGAASAPSALNSNSTTARVLKLRAADLHGLRAQRLRGALVKAAQASLLSLSTKTTIRPLIATKRLPRGGHALTLLGGDLAGTKAEIVIAGPGYTAVRDVRINHGLAGGRIILPRKRRAGRWYAGIIDYHALRAAHGHVTGRTILQAATWTTR